MEHIPMIIGYLVIFATAVSAIAVSLAYVLFVTEQQRLARNKESRKVAYSDVAFALLLDADRVSWQDPASAKLMREIASIIGRAEGSKLDFKEVVSLEIQNEKD
jgi:hypothetical protein